MNVAEKEDDGEDDQKRVRKVTYDIQDNSPFSKDDAQVFGQALVDICKKEDTDELTPDLVIEHARDPKSPLHKAFTWGTQQAAENYWRVQARKLLGAIRVKIEYVDLETQEVHVVTRKAFVSVKDGERRAYRRLSEVSSDRSLLRALYEEFRQRAQSFASTARQFKDPELMEIADELDGIILRMNKRFARRS